MELTKEERELVEDYRAMADEAQKIMREIIKMYAEEYPAQVQRRLLLVVSNKSKG